MKNFSQKLIISTMICFITSNMVLADSVMLNNGKVIEGKINHVLSNCVELKTEDGIKTIVRDITSNDVKVVDNIRVGIFKRKTVYGEVFYKDNSTLQIATAEGVLRIKKYKIRNINLAVQKDKL